MSEYNHKQIEKKWQDAWEKARVYETGTGAKKKCYVLDMFPYPSGAGLHVGHPKGYIATDIYSRYKRSQGFDVLHPMGWDAFGLPAENYAIKTKIPPQETTQSAIENFKSQIKGLSLSYDWNREINTSSPEYYRWTQWLFLKLYKEGLAYKKNAKVNYCDSCKTVLANEQVNGGLCERCGHEVIQKELPQWFFKITDFADALESDLMNLDWPESTKASQSNWIGKSEGAILKFEIQNPKTEVEVFTTRPDTLFGVTYLVLAPEHPLINESRESVRNWEYVERYIKKIAKKTDLERISEGKNKTGIRLGDIYAIHPITKEPLEIFISEYVLSGYGTGAIMAVPSSDERDRDFAKKYDLPIVEVIDDKKGTLINSGEYTGMSIEEAGKRIVEHVGGEKVTTYRLRDWLVSRQRYWGAPIPILYCDQCGEVPVPEKDLPVVLPTDVDFIPTGESPIARSESFHDVVCPKCGGKNTKRESDTLDTFVCSSWYYLRFTDPANFKEFASAENIKRWMPVDMYVGGAEHTVLHLLYARFITKVLQKLGYVSFSEPFLSLRHQGLIIAEDGRKMSKSFGNVINPDDIIERYGSDSMRLYEMFMGPFNDSIRWSTKNIIGVRRFIEKVWRLSDFVVERKGDEVEKRLLHSTIKKVTEDIEGFKFNTAISTLMIFINHCDAQKSISQDTFFTFLQLLAPFAPHISEELYQQHGGKGFIVNTKWPHYDEGALEEDTLSLVVQINGKVRGKVVVDSAMSKEEVMGEVRKDTLLEKRLHQVSIQKIVYVPGRVINIVGSESN